MKKIFRLSAIVAMLSMMATTATVTSCSDDDDDDDTTVVVDKWADAKTSVEAVEGVTYLAKNNDVEYTVEVVSAEPGKVVLNVNGKAVTVSDEGTSFCSIKGEGMKQAAAEADPESVLLALQSGNTKTIISGSKCKNETVAGKANTTVFIKK